MRTYAHHHNALNCPGCVDRLLDADPYLASWFNARKALQHPEEHMMHVSWSFRDKDAQDAEVLAKRSKLLWPTSKHNVMVDGKPCSRALDVFQQDEDGQGIWDPIFCAKLNAASVIAGYKLTWGGDFRKIGDYNHFEMA